MNDNHLSPLSSGFSSDYDPGLNPDVSNEFATVGFRFGHTLVQGMLKWVELEVVVKFMFSGRYLISCLL